MTDAPRYKRIVLKLSGQALQGETERDEDVHPKAKGVIDPEALGAFANELADAHGMGVQIGLVVGGGNVLRGAQGDALGIDRVTGDYMGMLGTVINALAIRAALERRGVPARVMTAIEMGPVAEPYVQRRALGHLEKGRIVIFAGGTGNPFFTTDTAAALRANEIAADALFKGTRVDGVYDSDPEENENAQRYDALTYTRALSDDLKVMDGAAISLCRDNGVPILVFNLTRPGSIIQALRGEAIGTIVSGQ